MQWCFMNVGRKVDLTVIYLCIYGLSSALVLSVFLCTYVHLIGHLNDDGGRRL